MLAKRAIDIVLALVGLVLLSPLAARGRARHPPARRRRRSSSARSASACTGGRSTSSSSARWSPTPRTQLAELEGLNEIRGPAFKLTDDPRLTRTGGWLRRTSIDELPQLWNVLRGEMSLVGPRPPLPSEVQDYDIWHRRRLSMQPGITGPVAGRGAA